MSDNFRANVPKKTLVIHVSELHVETVKQQLRLIMTDQDSPVVPTTSTELFALAIEASKRETGIEEDK